MHKEVAIMAHLRWITTLLAGFGLALAGCNSKDSEKKPAATAVAAAVTATKPAWTGPAPAPVAQPAEGARRTPSGLAIEVLQTATATDGTAAGPHDRVELRYSTWTRDGKLHFSSETRGAPVAVELRDVNPGMREGITGMRRGERRRLWIPEKLSHMNKRSPRGPVLTDVELLRVKKGVAPLPAPPDVAKAPQDAVTHASGMRYRVLEQGTGDHAPAGYDRVTFSQTVWNPAGEMLDSTTRRDGSDVMLAGQAPVGMREALLEMKVGEKRRLWIPAALMRTGSRPANEARVADVKLLAIEDMPDPPPAPADLKPPKRGVVKLPSGLVYQVLKKGTGDKHAEKLSTKVDIHFSGWDEHGKLFATTITQGYPQRPHIHATLKGFQEVLPQMVVGEKRRLWLPPELAHKGEPDKPQGPMVYDLELLAIY